jgi:hypothetical protein
MKTSASISIFSEIVVSCLISWLGFNYIFHGNADLIMVGELVKTTGSLSTISGSMLGWSTGIINGARSQLLDIDYFKVEEALNQVSELHKGLFIRWGWVVFLSACAVILATIGTPSVRSTPSEIWLTVAVCLETAVLWQIFRIFQKLRTLLKAKCELDSYERTELAKHRAKIVLSQNRK